MSLVCWLLHQHLWTTLVPGLLPFKLDGQHHCPICDKNSGHGGRERHTFGVAAGGFA